jgi:hypothetical protein
MALGSTSASHPGVDHTPALLISEDREVSMFDFAGVKDATPASDANGSNRRPEAHRTQSTHRPMLSFSNLDSGPPGPSPSFHTLDGTGGLDQFHEISSADGTRFPKASRADSGAAGPAIELLKTYRYNIAPWLDICDTDQHFGVELLTIARREPRLRTCVMRVAAAASRMAWPMEDLNAERTPSLEVVGDATDAGFNVEVIVSVLDLLVETTPNLAASWGRQKDQDRRLQAMETLLLEPERSNMHACAYWLSTRLGMIHP